MGWGKVSVDMRGWGEVNARVCIAVCSVCRFRAYILFEMCQCSVYMSMALLLMSFLGTSKIYFLCLVCGAWLISVHVPNGAWQVSVYMCSIGRPKEYENASLHIHYPRPSIPFHFVSSDHKY